MIRAVVVTDVRLCRDWIAQALQAHGLVDAVATVADLEAICDVVATSEQSVVLLDARMPMALEWLESVDCKALDIRVVGFAVDGNVACKVDWLQAGAAEVVEKESSLSELIDKIKGAANEEITLSPKEAGGVIARLHDLANGKRCDPRFADLTRQETKILKILAERGNRPNKQLARELGVRESTVKNHMHHVYDKLGVGDRMKAVALFRAHYYDAALQPSAQNGAPSGGGLWEPPAASEETGVTARA